jgi:hypothetical protein
MSADLRTSVFFFTSNALVSNNSFQVRTPEIRSVNNLDLEATAKFLFICHTFSGYSRSDKPMEKGSRSEDPSVFFKRILNYVIS